MSRVLVLFAASILPFAKALAVDVDNSGDIVVTDVRGAVTVRASDRDVAIHVGSVIVPPATIRTGADGAIDLRQGQTTVAIAANTAVDLPATSAPGAALDRIVQLSGSALYKVGKREAHKLRVETPHLVAVIKGTQFNVLAQPDRTTVALFEGKLEIRSPDDSDITDLHAGEIAVHRSGDSAIRVLKMDTGQTLRGQAEQPAAVGATQLATAGAADAAVALGAGVTAATTNGPSHTETVAAARSTEVRVDNSAEGASVGVSPGNAGVGVPAKVEVNTANANVGVSTSIGTSIGGTPSGGPSATAAAGGTIAVSTPAANVSVTPGVQASVTPTELNSTASVGVTAGNANVGATVSASVGVGSVNASVGGLNVDLGNSPAVTSTSTTATTTTPTPTTNPSSTNSDQPQTPPGLLHNLIKLPGH